MAEGEWLVYSASGTHFQIESNNFHFIYSQNMNVLFLDNILFPKHWQIIKKRLFVSHNTDSVYNSSAYYMKYV